MNLNNHWNTCLRRCTATPPPLPASLLVPSNSCIKSQSVVQPTLHRCKWLQLAKSSCLTSVHRASFLFLLHQFSAASASWCTVLCSHQAVWWPGRWGWMLDGQTYMGLYVHGTEIFWDSQINLFTINNLFFTSYSLLTIFAFIARVIVTFCLPEENNSSNCNIFIIKDYIVPLLLYCWGQMLKNILAKIIQIYICTPCVYTGNYVRLQTLQYKWLCALIVFSGCNVRHLISPVKFLILKSWVLTLGVGRTHPSKRSNSFPSLESDSSSFFFFSPQIHSIDLNE